MTSGQRASKKHSSRQDTWIWPQACTASAKEVPQPTASPQAKKWPDTWASGQATPACINSTLRPTG